MTPADTRLHRRALLAIAGGAAVATAACATRLGPINSVLVDRIDLGGAPGMALAVVRAGEVVALGGAGRRGRDDRAVPDADTVFEIGSLTKTFTACLIFELEREGRMDLTAPISRYAPDLPAPWRVVPLEALLSHTSGLPEYLDADNFLDLMPRDLTSRDLIALAADKPIMFEVGVRHAYNNLGFVLLGLAAETAGEASYWDQLERRFFNPAGMRRTGPRGRVRTGGNLASGNLWAGDHWVDEPPITAPGSTFSAGGLLSTAGDLARWAQAMDRGALVSASSRAKMWRPAPLADGAPSGWGYGWMVEVIEGRTVVSHGGGTAGFSCWLRRDVERRLTSIVLTNQNGLADPLEMTGQLLGGQ